MGLINKNMNRFIKTILILGIIVIPSFSFAASIKIEAPENINAGDTVLAKVILDTEGEKINVIEGEIKINTNNLSITEMNVGGSIFSLWPNKPSLDNNVISFVGGSPEEIKGKNLKVFDIAIKANSEGDIKLSSENIKVYLSDGSGTSIDIARTESNIVSKIGSGQTQNELLTLIENDKRSPEKFEIELGQDDNSFDGLYFISFNAVDKDSGIDRYEITEGEFSSVRSGNTYVLRDQTLQSEITVRAYDKAGNERSIVFNPQKSNTLTYILLIIVLVAIAFIIKYRFFKTRKWQYIRRV